jgi:hypothetical protein
MRNLTLHEAMILVLLESKSVSGVARMTNHELAKAITSRDLFRQENDDCPDEAQMFLRARQCPEWFDLEGNARDSVVTLRPIRCGGA